MIKSFLLIVLLALPASLAIAQVSHGGYPPSLNHPTLKLTGKINPLQITPPAIDQLVMEDKINDKHNMPYRFAYMLPVSISPKEHGDWVILPTEERIWVQTIEAEGALALQLIFDDFYIPQGGKLFIYDEEGEFIIGAFTNKNNLESGLFATQLIPGSKLTLEYVAPKDEKENLKTRLNISHVGYAYRGLDLIHSQSKSEKNSGNCMVNVNCSPEGGAWKDVSRSVTKIILGGYLCSGTLLNNTAEDFKNFVSTAFHCIEDIGSPPDTWIFYFNYERNRCINSSSIASQTNTVSGCEVRSSIPMNSGADGALLELNGTIPESYNVYYAGWSIEEAPQKGGVCIHHPQGDVKKISTVKDRWRSSTWYGEGVTGAHNAHWNVTFAPTPNGFGVSEGGSSGSGLFGPDELLRGVLTGGSSACDNPYGSNLFGKLSYNWDSHSNLQSQQFKAWLDPIQSGKTWLRGRDPINNDWVYWRMSASSVYAGDTIQFTDESDLNPTSWHWSFPGGTPSESTEKNPLVIYNQEGYFDVTLTVQYDKFNRSKTRSESVHVYKYPAWIQQNTGFETSARGISGISIVDEMVVWAWAYDGISPDKQVLEFTRTINGGFTWTPDTIVFEGSTGYGIGNIFALNADTAWASVFGPTGGGKIIKTTNGGTSWVWQTTATFAAPDGFPNLVYFWDQNNGFCQGDPNGGYFELYTTTDGGEQWTRVPRENIPTTSSGEYGTVNMYDVVGDTIWFGTNRGRVFRSYDRGNRWRVSSTGLSGQTDIKFRNSTHGIAYIKHPSFKLKSTTDGGVTWSDFRVSSRVLNGGIDFVPGTEGTWVTVGISEKLGSSITYDNWETFNVIDSDMQYTAVAFYNQNTGWAGGFNHDSLTGGIYKWNPEFVVEIVPETSVSFMENSDRSTNSLTVYPNPNQGQFTITSASCCNGRVSLTIIDTQGRVVHSETIESNWGNLNHSVNISHLKKGFYILRTTSGSDTWTNKIVIR